MRTNSIGFSRSNKNYAQKNRKAAPAFKGQITGIKAATKEIQKTGKISPEIRGNVAKIDLLGGIANVVKKTGEHIKHDMATNSSALVKKLLPAPRKSITKQEATNAKQATTDYKALKAAIAKVSK